MVVSDLHIARCLAFPKLSHAGWLAAAATGAAAIANAAPIPAATLTIVIVLSFMMFPSSLSTGGHGHRLRRCSDIGWCRRRGAALHEIGCKSCDTAQVVLEPARCAGSETLTRGHPRVRTSLLDDAVSSATLAAQWACTIRYNLAAR